MGKMIKIPTAQPLEAYLSEPETKIKGGIIVIHEVWGLTDHIKAVTDRFASVGYLALAPSLIDLGFSDSTEILELQKAIFDPKKRNEAQPKLRKLMSPIQQPDFAQKTIDRLKACFNYLFELPSTNHNVSVIGFCFGGSYSFSLAIAEPRLKIALAFYGHADQSVDELRKITCPVRAYYGELDERLISSLPELTTKMKQAGVNFKSTVYPKCGHAFFNDSNPLAYNEIAAKDAWLKIQHELASVN